MAFTTLCARRRSFPPRHVDGIPALSIRKLARAFMSTGAPGVQAPALQTSSVVHALPSSHGPALLLLSQRPAMQVSSVHGLPSSQSVARTQSSAVGIVQVTSDAYRESLRDFLAVVGLVSLALALLNLLPVLPLDGGHIVMALLERVRGRAFSQLAYLRYSAVGLTLFALLLYLGLRNDLFSGGSYSDYGLALQADAVVGGPPAPGAILPILDLGLTAALDTQTSDSGSHSNPSLSQHVSLPGLIGDLGLHGFGL